MRLRRVGDNHFIFSVCMFEEIINSFFFHQARSKIEIRFTILNAVISRFEVSLQFI